MPRRTLARLAAKSAEVRESFSGAASVLSVPKALTRGILDVLSFTVLFVFATDLSAVTGLSKSLTVDVANDLSVLVAVGVDVGVDRAVVSNGFTVGLSGLVVGFDAGVDVGAGRVVVVVGAGRDVVVVGAGRDTEGVGAGRDTEGVGLETDGVGLDTDGDGLDVATGFAAGAFLWFCAYKSALKNGDANSIAGATNLVKRVFFIFFSPLVFINF